MGVPKLRPSDVVGTAINGIKALKGRKKEIDDKLEYYKLDQLMQDVLQGKYDKNSIEKDANYIKGLQIEYESKYGKPAEESESFTKPNYGANEEKPVQPPVTDNKKANEKNSGETTPPTSNKPIRKNPFAPKPKKPELDKTPESTKKQPASVSNKQKNSANNNSGNNGLIINGDNNVIFGAGAVAGKGLKPEKPLSPEEKAKKAEEDIMKASKENFTSALADGAQVAKDLIGSTNTDEKQNAIRLIMKQTKETIMGFIHGFNKNDTVLGVKYGVGGLIDQIDNEGDILGGITDANWTDSEKKEVFVKIMSTVLEWAKDMGFEQDSNYQSLQSILKSVQKDEEIDTARADKLIKELISKGMAKTGV